MHPMALRKLVVVKMLLFTTLFVLIRLAMTFIEDQNVRITLWRTTLTWRLLRLFVKLTLLRVVMVTFVYRSIRSKIASRQIRLRTRKNPIIIWKKKNVLVNRLTWLICCRMAPCRKMLWIALRRLVLKDGRRDRRKWTRNLLFLLLIVIVSRSLLLLVWLKWFVRKLTLFIVSLLNVLMCRLKRMVRWITRRLLTILIALLIVRKLLLLFVKLLMLKELFKSWKVVVSWGRKDWGNRK